MFNYLSATLPYAPEGFEFNKPVSRTDEELRLLVRGIELSFDLPKGTLEGRKKLFREHSLPDIRAAVVMHITDNTLISFERLAPIVGFSKPSSACKALKRAKAFLDTRDQKFSFYLAQVRQQPV